jgi:hypothetical protein
MTNGRGKDTIGQTALSYLENWVKSQVYDREKTIQSKYLTKGLEVEADIFQVAADYFGWVGAVKNEMHLQDDHLTGTPDIIMPQLIVDMKASWDCFTFPLFDTEPDKAYWWQLQGYMALTGVRNARLVYVLHDAPVSLIEREAWAWVRSQQEDELTEEIFEEFKAKMTYSHLPLNLRVKAFSFERDDDAIQAIRDRVELCREIIINQFSV